VTQDSVSIIAEGEGEHGECLFLSDDLRFYVRNPAYSFMQSPALSLRFNEKDKFLPYQETISPKSALSLLWTLDDDYADARNTLTAYLADAPRLHIVAHFRTDAYTDYFLDNRLAIHTTAPYARGPFWPANDPTFFNLQAYFQPSNHVSLQSFRGHFLAGQEQYAQQLEEKIALLDELFSSLQEEGLDALLYKDESALLPSLFTSPLLEEKQTLKTLATGILKQKPPRPMSPTPAPAPHYDSAVLSSLQPLEQYQAPLPKPSYYRRILS
jgi:hypothetical protein